MIKCAACGLENPDDGKFCTNCGIPLTLPPGAQTAETAVYCTNCGAKLPPDSKFCTSCGTAAGGSGASITTNDAVSTSTLQEYLSILDQRLAQNGFENIPATSALGLDRQVRRKRFQLALVGSVTTFCGVKMLHEPATAAYVKSYSKSVFDFAVSNKGFLARNAFQQLLVYPVLIVPSCGADVEAFLNTYWNKHWMAYEYPVVISVSTRRASMHRSTPVWGAAFHGIFKREAESLFAV
jgi:hypothetical protein